MGRAITWALVDVVGIRPYTKGFVDNLGSLQAFGSYVLCVIVHFKLVHPRPLVRCIPAKTSHADLGID